jgi:hypothetical protein
MTPNQIADRLAALVRRETDLALGAREQAGFVKLQQALEARKRGPATSATSMRAVRRAWSYALVAAVACACALFFVRVHTVRESALTFQVIHGTVGEDRDIASDEPDTAVLFSDRSELVVDRGARLRVAELEARGARVLLETGGVHVHIQHRSGSSWAIDAGPYVVHVTGTEFDLAWNGGEQTLDLLLRRGSVTVNGPLAEEGIQLVAGQHLRMNAASGSLSIASGNASGPQSDAPASPPTPGAASSAGAAEPADTTSGLTSPSPMQTDAPTPASVRSAAPGPAGAATAHRGGAWTAGIAPRDFEGLVAVAERRGLDRTLADSSAADLAALADAARYTRRPDIARRALAAERDRYAASREARDAAFFLGGIAEAGGDANGALDWYETYLRESGHGPYAAEALGRKMTLVLRLHGPDDARPIAAEYLRRFREGAYAPNAAKLLDAR